MMPGRAQAPADGVLRRNRTRLILGAGTLVAAVATAGSLWFSLGLGLVPCDLCWYQRILMYPLVVVIGVATLEARPTVWRTVLPLSILGGAIAFYHSYLQATTVTCGFGGHCGVVLWELPVLGLSIPNLSLVAFVLVTVAMMACWYVAGADTPSP